MWALASACKVLRALGVRPRRTARWSVRSRVRVTKPACFASTDELDCGVMFDEEVFRDLTDGRALGFVMSTDGQQQLMLAGGQAMGRRLLGAPLFELPQPGADPEQLGVVVVADRPSAHHRSTSQSQLRHGVLVSPHDTGRYWPPPQRSPDATGRSRGYSRRAAYASHIVMRYDES